LIELHNNKFTLYAIRRYQRRPPSDLTRDFIILYGLYPVFLHGSGNAVFAARFTNFMQISMDPTITVDSVAQRIGVADKFQQSLVILFSGRNRLIKPDIKSSTGIFRTRNIVTIDQTSR
jgi:hypothetical protein